MNVITDPSAMQRAADGARAEGKTIAFVPTMGALHDGHLTLIREAVGYGDTVVTSIFVNPTQFGQGEDFDRYPRDLDRDAPLAADAGCDILFVPSQSAMYPGGHATFVNVEGITEVLEGKSRPGHFRGVATIVAKLCNIVKPHVLLLGQKDGQQVAVLRRMLRDLQFDVRLVVVPTVREDDGLAMSSRNVYLTPEERAQAPVLCAALRMAEERIRGGESNAGVVREAMRGMITSKPLASIDYVSVAHGESLEELVRIAPGIPVMISLAVRFGTTRLIDNTTFTL
ncbi:MAG: pantoate--beta-alanine ligase [Bacteroidetes bacterium]|nr:pantoate--beta-alanine ligase [Bacteroidota bacterium]